MKDISQAAAAMGRKGGKSTSDAKKAASRKNLTKAAPDAESRKERAKKAAAARWGKK